MWVRLEDDFFDHPKIKGLPALVQLFHVRKLCYCGRWLRDGRVPKTEARGKREHGYVMALVSAGVWHTAKELQKTCRACWDMVEGNPGDGWVIHHFLRYNPSKAETERRRAQAKVRNDRWETRKRREGDASDDASGDASETGADRIGTTEEREKDSMTPAEAIGRIDDMTKALTKPVPPVSRSEIRAESGRVYGRQLSREELA